MTLHIKVKPGSKVDDLFYDAAGRLHAKIKAPAQDGKANAYLTEFLAERLGIAKSGIEIVAGFTNPHKRLAIAMPEEKIESILATIRNSTSSPG